MIRERCDCAMLSRKMSEAMPSSMARAARHKRIVFCNAMRITPIYFFFVRLRQLRPHAASEGRKANED